MMQEIDLCLPPDKVKQVLVEFFDAESMSDLASRDSKPDVLRMRCYACWLYLPQSIVERYFGRQILAQTIASSRAGYKGMADELELLMAEKRKTIFEDYVKLADLAEEYCSALGKSYWKGTEYEKKIARDVVMRLIGKPTHVHQEFRYYRAHMATRFRAFIFRGES